MPRWKRSFPEAVLFNGRYASSAVHLAHSPKDQLNL